MTTASARRRSRGRRLGMFEAGSRKRDGNASRGPAVGAAAATLHLAKVGEPGMVESGDNGAAVAEPTINLIRRIREGDAGARDQLLRRFLPLLKRWAHGRLPRQMRDLNETDDLVQVTLVKALARLDDFESAGPGAFLAYLRQALLNQVRDEIRRHQRRPEHGEIDVELSDPDAPALIEQIVGSERVRAYEQALAALPKRQQGLIVMRVEFGMSYPEIAAEVDSTPDAVRVMVARAIVQLSRALG